MSHSHTAALLVLALAAGCTPDAQTETAEAAQERPADAATVQPTRVDVVTRDYGFDAPTTIPAGMTRFVLRNEGPEPHHIQIVKLEEGKTLDDFGQVMAAGEAALPSWVRFIGGPNVPDVGQPSEATLELEPGSYAFICVIPSPDGVLHVAKGMAQPFTVTEAEGAVAAAPPADLEMKLMDYGYDMNAELTAGRRTIAVSNTAEQPHEVVIVKLPDGVTAEDVVEWAEAPTGPPPASFVGGTSAISQDGVNYVTADFEPGRYALLCFLPDARDGRPHVAHGMVRTISVS